MNKDNIQGSEGMLKFNRVSPFTNTAFSLLFIILAAICVMPLIFVIIISFSSDASIQRLGYSLTPNELTTFAYTYLWNSGDTVGRAFFVSIFVTVVGTALGLILNATMGYVLSRPTFKLKKLYTTIIFIPMIFNGGLVASYMVVTQLLRLQNTLLALILPLACSSFHIIILRTFFQTTVPDSVIESDKIDCASQLKT